jgi:hypothetical protein
MLRKERQNKMQLKTIWPNDWYGVRQNFQKLNSSLGLGPTSKPTFAGIILTDLTASTLIGVNASKVTESVTIGTGLDYTRPTLSLSHLGIEALTDPGGDRIFFWDNSETASKWLDIGNSIAITNTTFDTIQDIRNTASPTFESIILGSDVVFVNDPHGARTNTDDGSDNKSVYFAGGGAFGNNRGACFICHGNECAGDASGKLYLYGGNVTDGDVIVNVENSERGRFRTEGLLVTGALEATSINLTTNTGLILVDGTTFLADDGTRNLFLGADAFDNDSGSYNIGIGFEAGKNNDTTGAGEEGDASIYIGYRAGYGGTTSTNNTGYGNIAIGSASLYLNTSGYHNVGIGRSSLYDNTTGDFNMAIGAYACGKNTIGGRNVAVGYQALYYNVEGFDNIGIGEAAGRGTSGQSQWWNVLIGRKAGYSVEAAHGNVCIGYQSGQSLSVLTPVTGKLLWVIC